MEFEPDMTNLLLQLKINNIIKSSNREEGIVNKPKVIKTETTQKMIDEYKELQNQPVEIGGKKYAYHPGATVVNLDAPTLTAVPFNMQDLMDALEQFKQDLNDVDDFLEQQKVILKNAEEKLNIDVEDIDREIEIMINKKIAPGSGTGAQKNNQKINKRLNILGKERNKLLDNFDKFKDTHNARVEDILDERKDIINNINKADSDKALYKEIESENIKQSNLTEDANKKKIDEYLQNIQLLNNKPLSIDRFVGESQEDYLQRIQEEIVKEVDENEEDVSFQANVLNRKKLLSNLSEIISDTNKKESIIKLIGNSDDMFLINKYWKPILKKIKETFIDDNKNLTADDYYQLMATYLQGSLNVKTKEDEKTPPKQGDIPVPDPTKYTISRDNIFFNESKRNLIISYAQRTGQSRDRTVVVFYDDGDGLQHEVYFKAITHVGKNFLTASVTGFPGSFKTVKKVDELDRFFSEGNIIIPERDIIYEFSRLHKNYRNIVKSFTDMLIYYFPKINAVDSVVQFNKKGDQIIGASIRGGSLAGKETEYKKLGDVQINVKKLNKNILVIKDKNTASIKAFPNTKITESLHDVILDIINNVPIKEKDIKTLDDNEQNLYNALIHISGKNRETFNTIKNTIKYYKNRFNVLSGEIEAGNDNPKLMNEVYVILNHLYKMGEIKQKQVKQIYKDLEELQKNI